MAAKVRTIGALAKIVPMAMSSAGEIRFSTATASGKCTKRIETGSVGRAKHAPEPSPIWRTRTKLRKVEYRTLNARQKENFNFQKVSAILADYGFATMRLSDDWQGADFIAQHIGGEVLRVQLESRLAFYKKYRKKCLYIAFGERDAWYLYPHDELFDVVLRKTNIGKTLSMRERGGYSFASIPGALRPLLDAYRISGDTKPKPLPDKPK
jgi:hypothetical protein